MALQNDLDNFRSAWKDELNSKTSSNSQSSTTDHADVAGDTDCRSEGHILPIKSGGEYGHDGSDVHVISDTKADAVVAKNYTLNKKEKGDKTLKLLEAAGPSEPSKIQTSECDLAGFSTSASNVELFQDRSEIKKRKNTYQPFLLAESLLEVNSFGKVKNTENCETDETVSSYREQLLSSNPKRLRLSISNKQEKSKDESLVDILISDLDEISEIPFFDLNIPREVAMKIFCHLDAVTLCRCAQVSKAWASLANDEYLWCNICHTLGYEEESLTVDQQDWKDVVKQHVTQEKQLQYNWKNRTGEIKELQYVSGGILCAAASCGRYIVGGYTNGQIKLWNEADGEECLFHPSHNSLVLNERQEQGLLFNLMTCTAVSDTHIVAGYSQGNVDVWTKQGTSTSPTHSFYCSHQVSSVYLAPKHPLVAIHSGTKIRVDGVIEGEVFSCVENVDFETKIQQFKFLPRTQSTELCSSHMMAVTLPETQQIQLYVPHHDTANNVTGPDPSRLTCIHEGWGQGFDAMDGNSQYLGVAMTTYDVYDARRQLHLFDLSTCKQTNTYSGHHSKLSCVNIRDSPHNMAITGGMDKQILVYDFRIPVPVVSFRGSSPITCVQMDDWKVVSGSWDGLVCVWDQRVNSKLWELHNRHPVQYLHFEDSYLFTANIPQDKVTEREDQYDNMVHRRHRGSIQAYDFSISQDTQGVPDICLSTFDEDIGYNYNIKLAMPYDKVT